MRSTVAIISRVPVAILMEARYNENDLLRSAAYERP